MGQEPVMPSIPDRGSKPVFKPVGNNSWGKYEDLSDEDSDPPEPPRQQPIPVTTTPKPISVTNTNGSNNPQPPVIDRTAKARMLLAQAKHDKPALAEVLQAEHDLVEGAVEREREEIKLEEQWEFVRLKREKEAEEEMKQELLKKEEALMETIEKMREDRESRDKENEDLKRRLNELMDQLEAGARREEEGVRRKEEEQRMEEDIARKARQEAQLRRELEAKRKERMRRERERKAREQEMRIDKQKAKQGVTYQKLKTDERPSSNTGMGGGGLSRTISSPDIQDLLAQENRNQNWDSPSSSALGPGKFTIPTPRFDRSAKPESVFSSGGGQAQKFQATLSLAGGGKKGLTGLKNLGNTCYMNSIFQCLSNFTIPSQYFMDQAFKRELNNTSETRGQIACEYSELVGALWSGHYRSIAPHEMKKVVAK